jgi:tetratricopeptide (TPR) repeat protein
MPNPITPYDHLNGFYRPGLSLIEQLMATTVGRDDLLGLFLKKLKARHEEDEKQNFMIMGPPGAGKTHFIRVLAETVHKSEELARQYLIIQFPEENHRILTFADLLLGIIEILGNISSVKSWNTLYDKLIELEDDTELIDTAIPELEKYCETSKKSLLILLENIDVFFKGQLRDSKNLKQFKKFIIKSPFATFIGTSQYNLIKSDELRKPPFNLFDIHLLDVLEDKQTVELIKKNLEWEKQVDLLRSFDDLLPRLKALFEMSGGNPRLSLILYELIAKENKWDIKRQIEKLLDQTTPFFRVRMRSLAPQERALLETIALVKLEQKTAGFIAKCLRQSLQQTISHLNKLLKAGYLFVTDHPTDKRSKIYRIKEGFFGLWLAIGHSREQNTILPRLVEFLEQWYAEQSGRERKRQQIWHTLKMEEANSSQIEIDNQELLLKYLSDIGDKEEKVQSKFELIFYFLTIGKTRDAKKLMMEIYELHFEKPDYLDWMLKQCRNWILGKIEPVILQQMEDVVQCWKLKNLNETELLTKAALNLVHSFFVNGFFELIESFVEDMLTAITDPGIIALLLERVATSQEKMKRWNEALKTWNLVLKAAKQSGDLRAQGTILNNISQIYQDLSEFDTALTYLTESLDVLKKINDFDGQGTTLNNISTIYFERGYYEKALERLEQALSVAKIGRNLFIEGITLSNISLIYQARGDFERALEFLNRARLNMKRINNRSSECIALNNISQIYLEIGNLAKSFENLQTAIQIAKEDLNKPAIALSLYNRGKAFLKAGKEREALADLVTAYQLAKEEGLKDIIEKLNHLAESLGNKNNETFWQDRQKDVLKQESHVGLSETL